MTLAPPGPVTRTPPAPAPTPVVSTRFRPELHGLRAVAVALVVVYHVWFNRVSGGVDVFFLLTGFLLVGRLVNAAAAGPLPLRRMWTRNAARLLPAATVVLLLTLVAASVLMPSGRLPQTVLEVLSSALLTENWLLAADSVDYAARSNIASVVQHFWSLSIQGQVLIALPLMVAALVAATGRGPGLRERLILTLVTLTLASLAFSVVLTLIDQPLAYFHSLTRLWEFGLGGVLALYIDRLRLDRWLAVLVGWVGVLGLLTCGAVLQVGTVFPGFAALWPTGCAALVLLAGTSGSRWGVDRLLATRPVHYLGDLSYTLYLWHWPILMITATQVGTRQIGLLTGLAVISGALALAALTHHFVERRSGRRVAAIGLVTVLVVATSWYGYVVATTTRPVPHDERHPGALVLAGIAQPAPRVDTIPPMMSVYQDWVHTDLWNCTRMSWGSKKVCRQPVDRPPLRQIVVVGDSHVQQYAGALEPLARQHGWQLISIVLGGCPFTASAVEDGADPACVAWNTAAMHEIFTLRPDAVVTMATRDVRRGNTEVVPRGFVEQWRRLHELGLPVLAIRDNPRFSYSPPDCLQRHGREAPGCGIARDSVYSAVPPWKGLPITPNVTFLDTADLLCDHAVCPAEVGNVLVYMDDNHISGSFAATLAPVIDQRVQDALGW